MNLDFLTPEVFDALVWAVILIGGALAILRLYRDLSGPPQYDDDASAMPPVIPPEKPPSSSESHDDLTES